MEAREASSKRSCGWMPLARRKRPSSRSATARVIVAICVGIIAVKGFSFGVEFTGGVQYRVDRLSEAQSGQAAADKVRDAIADAGIEEAGSPVVTTSGPVAVIAQVEPLNNEQGDQLRQVIQEALDVYRCDFTHQTMS